MANPKRPRDPNQRGKLIVEIATGQAEPEQPDTRDPAAVERGRKGGKKGGPARRDSMTPEQRSEVARRAAEVRWRSRGSTK